MNNKTITIRLPSDFVEINMEMSNFDHSIDAGFEDALKDKWVFGRHAAWNFNGSVWHENNQFHSEIWVYHRYQETLSADSLEELMIKTNEIYGYD
jgi:hypothetical protein